MRSYPSVKSSIVSVEPTSEPLSIDEVKNLLKVETNEDDLLIQSWIKTARQILEQKTGRSFITQTRKIVMDAFPCGNTISLLHGPVQSVTSITYIDENGDTQTLTQDVDYYVDIIGSRVCVKNSWPGTDTRPNAVEILYVCGYGSDATNVPGPLRSAMKMRAAHLYENRQSVVIGAAATVVPLGEDELISTFILTEDVID